MREILFRGKSKFHGGWEYGDLITSSGDFFIGNTVHNAQENWCEVHPETVGQFTGLLDKNGKRIFEGDVLRVHEVHDDWLGERFEVRHFQGMFILVNKATENRYTSLGHFFHRAVFNYKFDCDFMKVDGSLFEIIGNIHDSPDHLPPN